jgi:hypothetical protein
MPRVLSLHPATPGNPDTPSIDPDENAADCRPAGVARMPVLTVFTMEPCPAFPYMEVGQTRRHGVGKRLERVLGWSGRYGLGESTVSNSCDWECRECTQRVRAPGQPRCPECDTDMHPARFVPRPRSGLRLGPAIPALGHCDPSARRVFIGSSRVVGGVPVPAPDQRK